MEIWHVYPIKDAEPHQLEGYDCKCKPAVEYIREEDRMLVIHNSFDGREAVEWAKEILEQPRK